MYWAFRICPAQYWAGGCIMSQWFHELHTICSMMLPRTVSGETKASRSSVWISGLPGGSAVESFHSCTGAWVPDPCLSCTASESSPCWSAKWEPQSPPQVFTGVEGDKGNFQLLTYLGPAFRLPGRLYFNIYQGQNDSTKTSEHRLYFWPQHTLYIYFVKTNNQKGAFQI